MLTSALSYIPKLASALQAIFMLSKAKIILCSRSTLITDNVVGCNTIYGIRIAPALWVELVNLRNLKEECRHML
jgi:serine protease inhibitor